MNAVLGFDPATHRYTVNGQVWPSVTQILEIYDLYRGVPRNVLDAAAAFGNAVHEACHLDNQGRLDNASLDRYLQPYVQAWRAWQADTNAVIVASELRVVNHRLTYCGTLDAIARIGGVEHLVDIKTSVEIPPTVGAQTAAYAEARGTPRIRRRVVQLRADGTYRSERLSDSADWNRFLSARNVHFTLQEWSAQR